MASINRSCQRCGTSFSAKTADVKRGWAKFCSKSCKASAQEQRTGQFAAMLAGSVDRDMDAAGHPMASGFFGHGQE